MRFKVESLVRNKGVMYYYCKSDVGVEGYIKKDKLKVLILNKLVDNASIIKNKSREVIRVPNGLKEYSMEEARRVYSPTDGSITDILRGLKLDDSLEVLSNKEKYDRWVNKRSLLGDDGIEVEVISDEEYKLVKVPDGYGEFVIPDFITHIGKNYMRGPFSGTHYSVIRINGNIKDYSKLCSCMRSKKLKVIAPYSGVVRNFSNMFMGCMELEELDISGLDTSKGTTFKSMFNRCSVLKSIDLSTLDTRNAKDMSNMFNWCSSLGSLDLSGLDTRKVEDMSWIFGGCRGLTSLKLIGIDTSKVKSMKGLFSGCERLKRIDTVSLNTSEVDDMSYMFSGCVSIRGLDLKGFDTSKVTDMSGMFSNCSNLECIDLSGFNTSELVDIHGIFSYCYNIRSISIPINTNKVKRMNSMFVSCKNLRRVDLSSFNTSKVIDMGNMFRYCENLERLDIGNFRGDSLCNIANMFDGCTSIEYIDINGIDTRYMKELYKSQRKMFNINPLYGVFYDCKSLKGLNVGDGFDPTGGYMVFYGCNNLSLKGVTLNYKGKVGDKVKRVISYGKRGSAGR